MKKGEAFNCGHGLDPKGTPIGECPECHEKTKQAIAVWVAKKNVESRVQSGRCPF